eukprot:5456248-Prymnesium_polylepis.2
MSKATAWVYESGASSASAQFRQLSGKMATTSRRFSSWCTTTTSASPKREGVTDGPACESCGACDEPSGMLPPPCRLLAGVLAGAPETDAFAFDVRALSYTETEGGTCSACGASRGESGVEGSMPDALPEMVDARFVGMRAGAGAEDDDDERESDGELPHFALQAATVYYGRFLLGSLSTFTGMNLLFAWWFTRIEPGAQWTFGNALCAPAAPLSARALRCRPKPRRDAAAPAPRPTRSMLTPPRSASHRELAPRRCSTSAGTSLRPSRTPAHTPVHTHRAREPSFARAHTVRELSSTLPQTLHASLHPLDHTPRV